MRFRASRLAFVFLGALVILPWVKVGMVLHNPPTVPATTVHAEGVVWADRVFVNRHELAVWLRSRGASYDEWVRNHPALTAGTVQTGGQKPIESAQGRTVAPAQTRARHSHAAPAQGQPTVVSSNSWLSRLGWLALAVVLTAGLIVAVARSVQRAGDEAVADGEAPILDELWGTVPAQRVHVRSSASSR
jgi:hypothetical protein